MSLRKWWYSSCVYVFFVWIVLLWLTMSRAKRTTKQVLILLAIFNVLLLIYYRQGQPNDQTGWIIYCVVLLQLNMSSSTDHAKYRTHTSTDNAASNSTWTQTSPSNWTNSSRNKGWPLKTKKLFNKKFFFVEIDSAIKTSRVYKFAYKIYCKFYMPFLSST